MPARPPSTAPIDQSAAAAAVFARCPLPGFTDIEPILAAPPPGLAEVVEGSRSPTVQSLFLKPFLAWASRNSEKEVCWSSALVGGVLAAAV